MLTLRTRVESGSEMAQRAGLAPSHPHSPHPRLPKPQGVGETLHSTSVHAYNLDHGIFDLWAGRGEVVFLCVALALLELTLKTSLA